MIQKKETDILCIVMTAAAFLFSCFLIFSGNGADVSTPEKKLKAQLSDDYKNYLFDDEYVHEINIIISDLNWDFMTKNAVDEQYVRCDAEIDGEFIPGIAIRPKGNSSLAAISNAGDTHFSFKLEFDAYDKEQTYHGLDKLSLGNFGMDPSCMKDFLAYHMMNFMNVPAPLSSYVLLKINGEDFGLYLAAEGVEDSFCHRNYGDDFGCLYKPDSFSMDSLSLDKLFDHSDPDSSLSVTESIMNGSRYADKTSGERVDIIGDMVIPAFSGVSSDTYTAALNYAGDDPKKYSKIFDTAVFDISDADKRRFVDSVRILNGTDDPLSAMDCDELARYFAVHDFVNNYDSYNSLFVHNFYLREKDGRFSLIPWDYNLAFGIFNYNSAAGSVLKGTGFDYIPFLGNSMSAEKSMVNYPIDTPVYSIPMSERPLIDVLFSDKNMLDKYHGYLNELLTDFFDGGKYDELFSHTYEIISPYVSEGLTFYSFDEFDAAAETLDEYCVLRTKSVRGQLDGDIPADTEGQKNSPAALIETGDLSLIKLTNFNSVLSVMDTETMSEMLGIILGSDFPHDTQGAVDAVSYYADDPRRFLKCLPQLYGIPVIRKIVSENIMPYIEAAVSVILLLISLSAVKKYGRRKYAAET